MAKGYEAEGRDRRVETDERRVGEERHLSHLLLDGPGASGEHDFVGWRVRPGDRSASPQDRLVSLHESLHGTLNDNSAWGLLLHGVAARVRAEPGAPEPAATLGQLISLCKQAHEAFATYLSLVVVGCGVPDPSLLGHDGPYLRYFDLGAALAGPFRGGALRYYAAYAALRWCMQSPVLGIVLERGVSTLRPTHIPSSLHPDERARALLFELDGEFWWGAWEQARSNGSSLPGWNRYLAVEEDPSRYDECIVEALDATGDHLLTAFHDAISDRMRRLGFPTLGFNGHRDRLQELIAHYRAALPGGGWDLRAASVEDPALETLEAFTHERLVLYEGRYQGMLHRKRAPLVQWIGGDEGQHHLMLVARPARRMREQLTGLDALGEGPVVALRASTREPTTGERTVHLAPITTPETLRVLAEEAGPDLPILASVSMALLADDAWRARWESAIADVAGLSILADGAVFSNLCRWAREGFSIDYHRIDLQVGEQRRAVFAFRPQRAGRAVFLAPCSDTLASALMYLMEQLPGTRADAGFLEEQVWELQVTLGHLLREEPFHDFHARSEP